MWQSGRWHVSTTPRQRSSPFQHHPLLLLLPIFGKITESWSNLGWERPQKAIHPTQNRLSLMFDQIIRALSTPFFHISKNTETTYIEPHFTWGENWNTINCSTHIWGFSNIRQLYLCHHPLAVGGDVFLPAHLYCSISALHGAYETMLIGFGYLNIDMCNLRCPRVFLSASRPGCWKAQVSAFSCIKLVSPHMCHRHKGPVK